MFFKQRNTFTILCLPSMLENLHKINLLPLPFTIIMRILLKTVLWTEYVPYFFRHKCQTVDTCKPTERIKLTNL